MRMTPFVTVIAAVAAKMVDVEWDNSNKSTYISTPHAKALFP